MQDSFEMSVPGPTKGCSAAVFFKPSLLILAVFLSGPFLCLAAPGAFIMIKFTQ